MKRTAIPAAREAKLRLRAASTGARLLAGISLAAVTFAATPAAAQTAAGVPTREELQSDRLRSTQEGTAQAVTVDGDVERAPCPLANPEFSDIRFTLSTVVFTGLEDLPADIVSTLPQSYAGLQGQEIPVAMICEIRDRAATALRRAGYLAAVQVPAQEINDGEVRLDVLVARITRTQIRGDAGANERLLARYVRKISEMPVFNINMAERYLLLARDIPGLDVRLSLRPTEEGAGAVIAEFSVVSQQVDADLSIQNFGSSEVGRTGALARVAVNGITGAGDRTELSVFSILDFEEQIVLQFGHDFTIGGEGMSIGLDFAYANTQPALGAGIDIESDTIVAGISASYPLVRSQRNTIIATGGFEYVDQAVDFAGIPLTEDTLSILYARIGGVWIDADSVAQRGGYSLSRPRWAINASVEARQGLDIFGASPGCGPNFVRCGAGAITPSRTEGDPTAFVLRAQARFDYRPTPDWTFSIAPRAQIASDPLFAYEEISGGNYTVGRGFDPGQVIGDSGFGFTFEISNGALQPTSRRDIALQPFAFFDAIWVDNQDAAFNGLNPQELYSAGGGMRALMGNGIRAEAFLAVPLNTPTLAGNVDDVRFLFSITAPLAPWNYD